MVEVPKNDERQREGLKTFWLPLEGFGDEAVPAGCLGDVAGPAAVPRDTAGQAQLFQWHESPEVAEYNAQGSCAAFHSLHL